MPKKQRNNKRQSKGFSNDSNRMHIPSVAEKYIRERNWIKAIEALSVIRPISQSALKQQVAQVFEKALNLAYQNKDSQSLAFHCQLLALDPNHLIGMRNFSMLLKRSGQYQDALYFIRKCLEIKPDCPDALNTLGTIFADLGQQDEAMEALKHSLRINPFSSNVNNNLANQYHLNAQIDLAFIYSTRAIQQDPNRASLWLDHLTHLKRVCDYDRFDRIDWWNVVNQVPAGWISTSFLQLLTLSENQEQSQLLHHVVERWGNTQLQQADEQPIEPFSNPPFFDGDPLRIGFISADFRDHSVARFIWPLFEHLDRKKFSLNCYSIFQDRDSWRERFEASANKMRDVHDLFSV